MPMSYLASFRRRTALLGATVIVALSGAGVAFHEYSNAHAQPSVVQNPAVPVGVLTVAPDDVRIWSEFSGRLSAVDYAEIRPEVSGRIAQVRIKDGQSVKAGDILFVIDPRPYEAALAKARANLASARTNAEFAKTELDRATVLIKDQAIAQRVYDERANAKKVADANVQAAMADLKQAEIDVDHAYVKAPIAGRLSRAEVTLGNLVQAGPSAQVLTSIVSNDGLCRVRSRRTDLSEQCARRGRYRSQGACDSRRTDRARRYQPRL
jgi:membrane fusion protein, multidrug efflux system